MTTSTVLRKWKISRRWFMAIVAALVMCFLAIGVAFVAWIFIGCWSTNSSEKATENMAGQISSLDQHEMAAIESSFRLNVPDDARKVCILFLHDWDGATAFMRIDLPSEQKQNLLSSRLFTGATERLRIETVKPPSVYDVEWWEVSARNERQTTILRLNTRGDGGPAIAVLQEVEGGLSVYIERNSRLDVYTAEFMAFISSHPKEARSSFPTRMQAFAGCWTPPAVRDDDDAATPTEIE